MSTAPTPYDSLAGIGPRNPDPRGVRNPLNLPAGSVRALITLMILGTFWTLLLRPVGDVVQMPQYLLYLVFLVLAHFFAAHGNSIGKSGANQPSPLYLPKGTLRLLIVLGFAAVVGWQIYQTGQLPQVKTLDDPQHALELPLTLLAAFLLGVLVTRVVGRLFGSAAGLPFWYQDLLAAVSLLAAFFLGAEVLIQLVVNPSISQPLDLPHWEMFLSGMIGFYFGARS